MQEGLAHEEERRAEAESSWQSAKLEIESLQTELEAAARAQSEQQSKLSLQLEYAHQVCGWLLTPSDNQHDLLAILKLQTSHCCLTKCLFLACCLQNNLPRLCNVAMICCDAEACFAHCVRPSAATWHQHLLCIWSACLMVFLIFRTWRLSRRWPAMRCAGCATMTTRLACRSV